MVHAIVYEGAYPAQMNKVENIGAFAQQLDKRSCKELFKERSFGEDAIKKKGYGNAEKVIVGDDANRAFQAGSPAFGNWLQGHDKNTNKYQCKARIGKVDFIGAREAIFKNNPCKLYAYKKFKAPAKKGEQHHERKIAKEPMPINISEYQYH